MRSDGWQGDGKLFGDLFVSLAVEKEAQDFYLPIRQRKMRYKAVPFRNAKQTVARGFWTAIARRNIRHNSKAIGFSMVYRLRPIVLCIRIAAIPHSDDIISISLFR